MLRPVVDLVAVDFSVEKPPILSEQELPKKLEPSERLEDLKVASPLIATPLSAAIARASIRSSLRASTLDGVFAAIFSNIAGGVLLSNFLVELDASPIEIGLLSSIPMLVNLIQPLGAYLSNRTSSRHLYCLWIFTPSRLLWLALVFGIVLVDWGTMAPQLLVKLALAIVLISHILGALGGASWLSWLAALVPAQLRGRYFGVRSSAASLTSLICLPLAGLAVSWYPGGSLQGYGVVLAVGIVAGLISLGFQNFMVDVNPQKQHLLTDTTVKQPKHQEAMSPTDEQATGIAWFRDSNFLIFLLYFASWGFATNLSNPFFNLYLLDNLSLDVSWVTLYNSLSAGATLLMLMAWGQLADRLGNRPILILVGLAVAMMPLLWLGVSDRPISVWLWLPLLHVLMSGAWAAIDLCNNNIQLAIAPARHHSTYFAIAAAVTGVSGALGTTVGGFVAQFADYGGLPGLFALSSMVRLVALLPLLFIHEHRSRSLRHMMYGLLQVKVKE
ncbi:MAG: MFS transporter [Scytolyngbya sp. HA4215-MV1]|jgi:Na+/melibiose symporter-like transporter|nr:MFS transporter [Scytolyngbya sp. HA4215-MV1]